MKKLLKICSPQLGLNPQSDLGGEVHDHFTLLGLAKKGHKIFVYLPKNRPYEKHKNVIIKYAPIKHIPALLFNFLIIPYLFKTYSREKFDLLRVHNPYFVGLGALFFKIFHPNVSLITTHHLAEESFIFNLINKITARKYDVIITVSNYLKNWLQQQYRVSEEKITVVYNGVSPDLKYKPKNLQLVKKFKLKNTFTLIFMGRLIDRKNPLFLLEVFHQLQRKFQNMSLIICGRGPLEAKMKNLIKKSKIENVVFAGNVFGKQKVDYFNLCDAFVFPSKNEGFGLVAAEAMACAKPVVAAKNSSIVEVVDNGINGYLTSFDKKLWVNKISKFLENPSLRKKMGQSARQKVIADFNWEKNIRQYEQLLLKIANA